MTTFKNKTAATALAAVFGTFGLHRFYLQGPARLLSWAYPVYFCVVAGFGLHYLWTQHPDLASDPWQLLHPALLVAFVPTFSGFLEAIVFALTPDEKWDLQWNAASGPKSDSNWIVIVIAILTLAIGATALMSVLAISIQRYYESEATDQSSAIQPQPNKPN